MSRELQGELDGAGLRIGIVVAKFNDFFTSKLQDGAMAALTKHGVRDDDITIVSVPGAFEIPLVAKKMAGSGGYEAVICLGAVIRGGTPHFEYVASACTRGLSTAAMDTGVPIIFGVLTVDSIEQAIERAGTKAGNKGADAAASAIEMVSLMRQL